MLEKEIDFIKLFGLNVIGPDNSNRYLVVDKNGKSVGFVQRKKLHKKNVKKGKPAIFGYVIKVDSSKLKYGKRIYFNKHYNINYTFNIRNREYGDDHVELTMSECPSMTVWSDKFRYINLQISNNRFSLIFKGELDCFNTQECVSIEDTPACQEYAYDIEYKKKDSEGKSSTLYSGIRDNYSKNELKAKQLYWRNGNTLKREFVSTFFGNVEEVIEK